MANTATKTPRGSKAASGRASSRSAKTAAVSSAAGGRGRKKPAIISAEELDRRFDAGEDVSAYFGPPMSPAQFQRYLKRKGITVPSGV